MPVLQKGEPVTFDLGLFDPAGEQIVESPLVDGSTMQATITDPTTGESTPLTVEDAGRGAFTADFEPARDLVATTLVLTLDAALRGVDGVALTSEQRSIELELRPPQDFPRIEPSQLDLPTIVGDGAATGSFMVVGSDIADGCVWFEPLEAVLPDGSPTPVEITPGPATQESCLSVPQGTTQTIEVSIDPEQAALGRVSGDLKVNLSSSTSEDIQRVSLPIRATMDVVPDAGTARNVLIALLVVGLLFPLLMLHLLNRVAARFGPAPQLLRSKLYPVRVHNGSLTERPDEAPLTADYREFEPVKLGGTARQERELFVNGATLRAHASGWLAARRLTLLSGPFGSVRAGGSGVIAGADVDLRSFPKVTAHQVPLAVPGTWVFWPDRPVTDEALAASEPIDGQLLLFIRTGRDIGAGEDLLAKARVAVPLRLGDLTKMVTSSLATGGGDAPSEGPTVESGDAGWDTAPSPTVVPTGDAAGWGSGASEPVLPPTSPDPPESSGPERF